MRNALRPNPDSAHEQRCPQCAALFAAWRTECPCCSQHLVGAAGEIDPARLARIHAYAGAFAAISEVRHVRALGLEPLPSQLAAIGEQWALARRSLRGAR